MCLSYIVAYWFTPPTQECSKTSSSLYMKRHMLHATRGVPPYVFLSDKQNPTKNIIALLDVESVARVDSSPSPWMGGHAPWMGTPSMDLTIRVQHIQKLPSVYSSFSVPSSPLPNIIGPPHPSIFTIFVDYPRVTGSTSINKDPWMGIIHESRATHTVPLMSVRTKVLVTGIFFRTALVNQFLGGEQSLVTGIYSKYSHLEGRQETWSLEKNYQFYHRQFLS